MFRWALQQIHMRQLMVCWENII